MKRLRIKLVGIAIFVVISSCALIATANDNGEYFIKLSSDQQTLYLQNTYTDPGPDDINIVLIKTSQLKGHATSKLQDATILYDKEKSIYKIWVLAYTGPNGNWSVYYAESDSLFDWKVKNIQESYYGVSDWWDISRQRAISVIKDLV